MNSWWWFNKFRKPDSRTRKKETRNGKMKQEKERKNAEIERRLMTLKGKQEKKLGQKIKKEKDDED